MVWGQLLQIAAVTDMLEHMDCESVFHGMTVLIGTAGAREASLRPHRNINIKNAWQVLYEVDVQDSCAFA